MERDKFYFSQIHITFKSRFFPLYVSTPLPHAEEEKKQKCMLSACPKDTDCLLDKKKKKKKKGGIKGAAICLPLALGEPSKAN